MSTGEELPSTASTAASASSSETEAWSGGGLAEIRFQKRKRYHRIGCSVDSDDYLRNRFLRGFSSVALAVRRSCRERQTRKALKGERRCFVESTVGTAGRVV